MSKTQAVDGAKKRAARSRAQWLAEVRRWRQSGQSGPEYAQARDLDAGTLAWWASRLRSEVTLRPERKSKSEPAFLAVRVRQSPVRPTDGTFEVVLANGRCVRVSGDFDAERVSRLLAAAEGGAR
jgi:hypothetical protein